MKVAFYLVCEAPWAPQHAGNMLAALNAAGRVALPLYPALVARRPLTPEQWAHIPAPCPGLRTALPAVLRRSEAEAALLVRHMPDLERQCLRTLALYLGAAQRRGRLPLLPPAITDRLLADCAAHYVLPPTKQHAQQRQRQRQQQLMSQQRQQPRARLTRLQKFGVLVGVSMAAVAASALLLPALKQSKANAKKDRRVVTSDSHS